MAMNRSGNREFQDDDEQRMLQDALGGVQTRPDSPLDAPGEMGPQHSGPSVPSAPAAGRTGWQSPGHDRALSLDMGPAVNKSRFEGFVHDRAASGGDPDSVKDATYRFLQGVDYNPSGKSMEENEAFLRSQIDAMRAAGLNVKDVRTDKILVDSAENPGVFNWVDLIRNSGGGGDQAFQWLPDDPTAQLAAPEMSGGLNLMSPQGGGGEQVNLATESEVLAQILGELQAAQGGGAPDEQQMLQSLLTEL